MEPKSVKKMVQESEMKEESKGLILGGYLNNYGQLTPRKKITTCLLSKLRKDAGTLRKSLATGLNEPRIVILGDSGVGKSSLVESLIEIDSFLPKRLSFLSSPSTRCPLEIRLNSHFQNEMLESIPRQSPHMLSSDESPLCFFSSPQTDDDEQMANENKFYQDIKQVEAEIQQRQEQALSKLNKFYSEREIALNIIRPRYPELTIVDLPGICVNTSPQMQQSDIESGEMINKKYLTSSSSFNIVVIPCTCPIACSTALKLAFESDPEHNKTMIIFNKIDTLVSYDRGALTHVINQMKEAMNPNQGWCLKYPIFAISTNPRFKKANGDNGLVSEREDESMFFERNRHLFNDVLLQCGTKNLKKFLFTEMERRWNENMRSVIQELREKETETSELTTRIRSVREEIEKELMQVQQL